MSEPELAVVPPSVWANMSDATAEHDPNLISIGDVADLTGISPDTIRVWERRYGRPVPIRLPSGHRRYSPDHVRWVRRVAEALARGHRPSKVVPLDEDALTAILESATATPPPSPEVTALLESVRSLDVETLKSTLDRCLDTRDPVVYLDEIVAPLIQQIGREWADGSLEIRHEHLASGVIGDQLRALRNSMADQPDAPGVVFATLQGEYHGLGLQMAALLAKLSEVRPIFVGTNTPNAEIRDCASETGAHGVAISVSLATGGVETDRLLSDLRQMLPASTRLVIGGMGARGVRRGPRHVEYVSSVSDFRKWLVSL